MYLFVILLICTIWENLPYSTSDIGIHTPNPTLANSSDEPGKHFSLVRPLPKTEATWFCGFWNISSQTTFITSTNDLSITRQTLAEIKPPSCLNFSIDLSLDTSGLMKLAKNPRSGQYKSPTNITVSTIPPCRCNLFHI